MADNGAKQIDAQALWEKYEDIAMHFNDLLMRLRSQSLAGIAAVSTLVGLFSKEGIANIRLSWEAATAIFIAMAVFWIAIWCLDFLYYNRLLIGAVAATTDLESNIANGRVDTINMSIKIEDEFRHSPLSRRGNSFAGVVLFYVLVLVVIVSGAVFSWKMFLHSRDAGSTTQSVAVATTPSAPHSAALSAVTSAASSASRSSVAHAACAGSAKGSQQPC